MNPFETPFDRLSTVGAERKPRTALRWADITFACIGAIGVVMLIAWRFM